MKALFPSGYSIDKIESATFKPTSATVIFTEGPKFDDATTSTATFSFTVDNAAGEVACVALKEETQSAYKTNNNLKPTAEQVFLGTDNNNADVPSAKVNSSDEAGVMATKITIDGLAKGQTYSAFCTATNGVPIFPGFVAYNSFETYLPIEFKTDGKAAEVDDDDDDSALLVSSNIVAICTMIAALIFN